MMSRNVVAVDNDTATLDLIEEVLKDQGYAMQRRLACELSVCSIAHDQPEFIILELPPLAPDNALLFLTKLRSCLATKALPVIVNSTNSRLLQQLDRTLHHLGCTTLEKPFDLDQFLAQIGQASSPHVDEQVCPGS